MGINPMKQEIGSPFRNMHGTTIRRSKFGVGKMIGWRLYIHKAYADGILPDGLVWKGEKYLPADFSYKCLSWDKSEPAVIRFDEAPDFDTAREPIPGRMITVDISTGKTRENYTRQIWHHKWEWVLNDYTGFDVAESYYWSILWTSMLSDISGIGSSRVWNNKLAAAGLE